MPKSILFKPINDFLNKTTMYKVLAYGLTVLALQGIMLSFFGVLSFEPFWMVLSLIVIVFACFGFNHLISSLLKIPINSESYLITGLILFLIIQPASSYIDLLAIVLICLFAMFSKYVLVLNRINIFNPAAVAALLSEVLLNYYATWWVGSVAMLPLTLIIGFLIVKKVRRFEMVGTFLAVSIALIFIVNFDQDYNFTELFSEIFASWPIIFFASVMLTEPLTMPGTKKLQLLYAVLVGILFASRFNVGPVFSTPEFALILGNLIFFLFHPRNKYQLTFKEEIQLAPDIYEFVFTPDKKVGFIPGQYLEWTNPHDQPDSRGNRRFFTIASSPTEDSIRLGIKMNNPGSSFKRALMAMREGTQLFAAQVAGDFILDHSKAAVFIAGGIGVTPFRSITKYLIDTKTNHKIDLFYFAKQDSEFVYKDIFASAEILGFKAHYLVSAGKTDLENLIKETLADYLDRKYYLSGPSAMVDSYKAVLNKMGIKRNHIVTDYFPGF